MEVVRITPRGYCHGVVEAIRMAKKVGAQNAGEPVENSASSRTSVSFARGDLVRMKNLPLRRSSP